MGSRERKKRHTRDKRRTVLVVIHRSVVGREMKRERKKEMRDTRRETDRDRNKVCIAILHLAHKRVLV